MALSALILVVGLSAAAWVYFTADDAPDAAASYLIIGGQAYPVDPSASRAYNRDLQRFGGKAAVVFDELTRWFTGLWRGRALAATLAWLSLALAAAIFAFAWKFSTDNRRSNQGKPEC